MPDSVAIEYITRELFKGKRLETACKAFIKKFQGKGNVFLGNVDYTASQLATAVLEDKARLAIEGSKRMRGGMGYISRLGIAQQFNLDVDALTAAIARIIVADDCNNILGGEK